MKEIIIKKTENRNNTFIAYFKNPLLKVTFSICFTDSIIGAIGLNEFFQMLKTKYTKDNFEFVVSDETIRIKNSCLLDQLRDYKNIKEETEGVKI